MLQHTATNPADQQHWLKRYYFARAGFSIVWILAVLAIAPALAGASAVLLVIYPAWDALANFVDAYRNGGLAINRTQLLNVIVSTAVAVGLALALPDMHHVLAIFGAWAILSGLLQLATAISRWSRSGAQWPMILSGAQSALAGAVFLFQAQQAAAPTVATLAGYAGFGAFYFLLSAVSLSMAARRRAPQNG